MQYVAQMKPETSVLPNPILCHHSTIFATPLRNYPMQINIILDALFMFLPKKSKMERKLENWLILNIHTGLVSPQFHCQYDDLFESTTGNQAQIMPKSQWQILCSFSHEGDQDSPLSSEPTEVTNINILPMQEMESVRL